MTFEVVKAEDGKFRWRLRDENGDIVNLPRPGKMNIPGTAAQKRSSELGVQRALAARFAEQLRARSSEA